VLHLALLLRILALFAVFLFCGHRLFPSRLYSTTVLRKLGNSLPLTSLLPLPPLL
jgi:hypothetical protein